MARVSTDIKRLFVRILSKSVDDGDSPSLEDALLALAQGQFSLVKSGEIAISTAGDGFATSYSVANPAQWAGISVAEIAALSSELLDLHDSCLVWLTKVAKYGLDADDVDEDGWPDPLPAVVTANPVISNADLTARMLALLVHRTSSLADYSQLHVNATA